MDWRKAAEQYRQYAADLEVALISAGHNIGRIAGDTPALTLTDKKDHRYSGANSEWFWERVKKIPWRQGGEMIYALGCALQDLEERVLHELHEYERKQGN